MTTFLGHSPRYDLYLIVNLVFEPRLLGWGFGSDCTSSTALEGSKGCQIMTSITHILRMIRHIWVKDVIIWIHTSLQFGSVHFNI